MISENLDPAIKSIVIAPTRSGQNAAGQPNWTFETIMDCVLRDKSPPGTSKFSVIGSDFSKYIKIYGVQIFGANSEAGIDFVNQVHRFLATTQARKVRSEEDPIPDSYSSTRIRDTLQDDDMWSLWEIAPGFDDWRRAAFSVNDSQSGINFWSADSEHKVGVVHIDKYSLDEIKTNRGFLGPRTFNDETTFDMNFRFRFSLDNISLVNGYTLYEVRHLVFMEFDYLQAFHDAGIAMPLQFDEEYESLLYHGFSDHMSTDAKVMRSIVEGAKLSTLDYYVDTETGELFSGTPYSETDRNGPWWTANPYDASEAIRSTARRLTRRVIKNNKVHYLDPRITQTSPSPAAARAKRDAFKSLYSSLDENAWASRHSNTYGLGFLTTSREPALLVASDRIRRAFADQRKFCSLNFHEDPGGFWPGPPDLQSPALDLIFYVNIPEIQFRLNKFFPIVQKLAGTNWSLTLLEQNTYSEGLRDLIRQINDFQLLDVRVYREKIRFVELHPDKNQNRIVKMGEKEEVYRFRESHLDGPDAVDEQLAFWNDEFSITRNNETYTFRPLVIANGHIDSSALTSPYTSYIYSMKLTANEPILPILRACILKVENMLKELEDFYNTALIPSFGLKTETTAGLYGMGRYQIREEDEEYPGSVDMETNLYTVDFASSTAAVNFNRSVSDFGGVINEGIRNYIYLFIMMHGLDSLPRPPGSWRLEEGDVTLVSDSPGAQESYMRDQIEGFLRVSVMQGPKTLGMFIEETRKLLSYMKDGIKLLTNKENNLFDSKVLGTNRGLVTEERVNTSSYTLEFEEEYDMNIVSVSPDKGIMYYNGDGVLTSRAPALPLGVTPHRFPILSEGVEYDFTI